MILIPLELIGVTFFFLASGFTGYLVGSLAGEKIGIPQVTPRDDRCTCSGCEMLRASQAQAVADGAVFTQISYTLPRA